MEKTDDRPELPPVRTAPATTPLAMLTALGIVYGDLGTSPLYAFQSIVQAAGGRLDRESALGSFSLVFWSLIITISIKYCLLVMRADNHGEGGILALMSLTRARWRGRGRFLVIGGLFGAALIYGDGIITPAISVLSALEGLNVATDAFAPHIVSMAVAILIALFAVQGFGTARVGSAFGPLMLIWFIVMGALGAAAVAQYPSVLRALDPHFAVLFLVHHGWISFVVLGAVFLVITGGEALYADMGHIGRNPIRAAWFCIVLPALVLNYAGQTSLYLQDPAADGHPFFRLAPGWSLYPLVALATTATIIASQAIITGSFSLTRQAMQLGWFPGVNIRQTSSEEYGQIYVPFVNWTMMLLTLALTIAFGSSNRLAGAYGTAVSTTMLLTTVLLYKVMRDIWRWPLPIAVLVFSVFLLVDAAFFSSNLLKIGEGGWAPLTFGALVFVVMTTWRAGIDAVHRAQRNRSVPLRDFIQRLAKYQGPHAPGVAVFLTRLGGRVPPLIVGHVEEIGAVPETMVALTVSFTGRPRVHARNRIETRRLCDGFWHVTVRYGFVEIPNLPATLHKAAELGCPLNFDTAVYFGERDEVVGRKGRPRMSRWRRLFFSFLFRNSVRAVDRFKLPPACFVEIGRQIEI